MSDIICIDVERDYIACLRRIHQFWEITSQIRVKNSHQEILFVHNYVMKLFITCMKHVS